MSFIHSPFVRQPLAIGFLALAPAVAATTSIPLAPDHDFEIYDPATDLEPPSAEFLAPHRGERKAGLDHDFSLRIADPEPGSGLDPKGFALEVDGRDVTAACSISAGLASCRGVRLDEGEHLAVARVRDRMGNVGRASRRFETRMWQGYGGMPKLELVSPGRLLASAAAEAPLRLRLADPGGSGIALGSLKVLVKDAGKEVDVSTSCVPTAEGAECRAAVAADGWYWVSAQVSNREGNEGQLWQGFYRLSGEDATAPTLALVAPADGPTAA